MLSYELCKKLKDAGFKLPQPHPGTSIVFTWINKKTKEEYIEPTLSELIEAILEKLPGHTPDSFKLSILKFEGKQKATAEITSGTLQISRVTCGATNEEAVANLYLTLNKKKV